LFTFSYIRIYMYIQKESKILADRNKLKVLTVAQYFFFCSLTKRKIISRHFNSEYTVLMEPLLTPGNTERYLSSTSGEYFTFDDEFCSY
jgi:hypothetical protein